MKKLFTSIIFGLLIFTGLLYLNLIKFSVTHQIISDWVPMAYDDRWLVGFYDNFFIATITSTGPSRQIDGQTVTRFEIELLKNIKGELPATMRLYQVGGYKMGQLYVETEAPLMKVGETYLLAGTPVGGQMVVTSFPGAHVLLDDGKNDTPPDVASLMTNERVQAVLTALPNQILRVEK